MEVSNAASLGTNWPTVLFPLLNDKPCRVKARLREADEPLVYQYRLRLVYPNDRTFEFDFESDDRLGQGYEFVVFGRTWRITGPVQSSRADAAYQSRLALECRQIA